VREYIRKELPDRWKELGYQIWEETDELWAMAKAWTGEAVRRGTRLGLQIHWAISYCDEHEMHLYYRKAKAGEMAFGDSEYHLEIVAKELGL
jgi:alkylation response protein AidB-like acyl-CoA dehydrogenase